jgi:hypothetical protein
MIFCKELNTEFKNKAELFKAIVKEYDKIVAVKKATIKSSDGVPMRMLTTKGEAMKSFDFMKNGKYYPVINTTNILDSHSDVHLKNIWTKSVKDQQGKVFYLVNHSIKVGDVVAWPDNVRPFVQELSWEELGYEYEGTTEALIYEVELDDDSNDTAVKAIKNKRPVQNSVRMQYVKIEMCINSGDKDHKDYKANYDKYFPEIANKEAEVEGYFWAVSEAKIVKEGSMVLDGSNQATPILENNTSQPSEDTDDEPPKSTPKRIDAAKLKQIINSLSKL